MIDSRFFTHIVLWFYLLTFCTASFAQLKREAISPVIKAYNSGDYESAFLDAWKIRQTPFGKLPMIDYLIAKSLCGMGKYREGRQCFSNIDKLYSLSKFQRSFYKEEAANCRRENIPIVIVRNPTFTLNSIQRENKYIAISMGKMGYVVDCSIDSSALLFDPKFENIDYDNRIFDITDSLAAIDYYHNTLGNSYFVQNSGRFIFITLQDQSNSRDLKEVTQKLEEAYQFYIQYYTINPPNKLITVYLMEDVRHLQEMAKLTHGITLPRANIGYSVLNDLSVLGNSDVHSVGTIYHELFHIMIKADIGDIPAWLDEGIASMYATSHWENGQLVGDIKQWRTQVLFEYTKQNRSMPSIATMVRNNWSEFTVSNDIPPCHVSVSYALAHHLTLYFQETKVLQKIVKAFKVRELIKKDAEVLEADNATVLKEVLGYSMEELQNRFDTWFEEVYYTERMSYNRRTGKQPTIRNRN